MGTPIRKKLKVISNSPKITNNTVIKKRFGTGHKLSSQSQEFSGFTII
jgi:hypothetical protein